MFTPNNEKASFRISAENAAEKIISSTEVDDALIVLIYTLSFAIFTGTFHDYFDAPKHVEKRLQPKKITDEQIIEIARLLIIEKESRNSE